MNSFYRGQAETLTVTVTADGDAVAIDAGSYQVSAIEYTLRAGQLEDSGSPAITKTLGAGIELAVQSGDTLGQAVVTLTTVDTAALTPGLYYEQVAVVFTAAPGQYVYVVPPQRRIVYGAVKVPA